ncbi:hypothetical protein T492DRAFT_896480 [Pavlovales sp. CCMP2436]|nr:hypothetical protein T492DRAFT_896480 [Pavlovales sp. CCMP2436]
MAGAASIKMMITNLTEKALVSPDLSHARRRSLSLFRDTVQHVPWVKQTYQVKYSEKAMTKVVAALFRERAHLENVHEIDRAIKKGRMDLEEVLHVWQGDMHVNAFFDKYLEVKPMAKLQAGSFLDKFYSNVD